MLNDKAVIASIVYDVSGALRFDRHNINYSSTNLNNISRRSTRTATLDGSSVLYDTGYSASDRTVVIAFYEDGDFSLKAKDLIESYEKVWLFLNDGAYIANPKSYNVRRGVAVITLEVIETA